MRSASIRCVARGFRPRFAIASMYLAEVPKCVNLSASAKSQSIRASRANGEPS